MIIAKGSSPERKHQPASGRLDMQYLVLKVYF